MAMSIPVISFDDVPEDTSSTVTPVKASFWTRAKARVVTIAKRIASPVAGAGRSVKTATVKAASATKRTVVKAASAIKRTVVKAASAIKRTALKVVSKVRAAKVAKTVTSAKLWVASTWRRVVRPFLKLRMIAFGVIGFVAALVIAPATTLACVFAIGLGLWLLSYAVEYLEASTSPAARMTLKVIEMIATFCKFVVFAATAVVTLFMSVMSPLYAVTEVLELVLRYLNVREAVGLSVMAYMAYMLLTGQWLWLAVIGMSYLPSLLTTEVLRRRSVDQQDVKPAHGNRRVSKDEEATSKFEEAMRVSRAKAEANFETRNAEKSAEESKFEDEMRTMRRVKLPKCTACSLDDGLARFSLRNHKGLCESCFKTLTDEDVIGAVRRGDLKKADFDAAKMAGVTLPRGRFALTDDEIVAASDTHTSRNDATSIYWIVTAWWRDGRGGQHVREWFGFKLGQHVATIEYRHERHHKGYVCRLLDANPALDKHLGVFQKLGRAQEVIADELSDLDIAEINAAEDLTVVERDLTTVDGAELLFASPEVHIEHVRRTQGTFAADALEETYLNEMIAQGGSS